MDRCVIRSNGMTSKTLKFHCPRCSGNLAPAKTTYLCKKCSAKWPVSDGVLCFNTRSFYWSQIPAESMKEMNNVARSRNWKIALEKVLLPRTDVYTFDYAVNESRGDWHFLLPIEQGADVLDLGCGWGAVTIPLSRFYNVVGADSTLETLKFLRIRAEQEGIRNLQLVMVDPGYESLPFPDSSFDAVVLNGVLEWIGTSRLDISPDECQRMALREIYRILKPDGCIYIGIENRYAYTGFLGAAEHGNIPFADIMPRKLANWTAKISGKKEGYRTYTHGYSGYKRLLSKAGFREIEFFFPVPSYREPTFIFPAIKRNIIKFFIQNKFIRSNVKRRAFSLAFNLHAEKKLLYSFGICARVRK